MTADALRWEFEEWFSDAPSGLWFTRRNDGEYKDSQVQSAWLAFVAGCASQKRRDAAIARLIDEDESAFFAKYPTAHERYMACEIDAGTLIAEAIEAGDHT